ncbi:MAG TPA: pyridoxal-phosphate dependent enzyme [Bacteroidales bacterium]|nr:pyridoxal-phosphate dependent enzyme [Bacteroidales bacterium]
MILPSLENIKEAHRRIKSYVHRTPVMTSTQINRISGAEIFFKCENFQKVGAFKFRGAMNAVLLLKEENVREVITHSSGNHAAALALAAKMAGMKAYVVMPRTAPSVKINAVRDYGAEITFCEPTQKAREEATGILMEKTGARLVHPYDNFNVICGQGTAAVELLEEAGELDILIAPVGGGGLLSGTSTAAKGLKSNIKVFGAEPRNADDAYRSFTTGILHPSVSPKTIADGLLTSLSELTFAIIRKNVDNIFTVSEESIIEAMRLIWERMKIIVEPSSAVTLAVVMENPDVFRGKKTGIILSGGNVELSKLPFNQLS